MAALPLTVNAHNNTEMEYHGKFEHILSWIQHIAIVNRTDIFYIACRLVTQTMSPTLTYFQVLNRCIQYLASRPHKPIFYPSSYYYGSKVIRLIWSGNLVEDYTIQNCPELCQEAYHARILNIRKSVSGIIHNLLGISVY